MPKTNNRNDNPLQSINQLNNEVDYSNFKYQNNFIWLCDLLPNVQEEKLEIKSFDAEIIGKAGLVYIFVINSKIFIIGHTTTNIKSRIASYNCGKKKYRKGAGTNSTANYYVLQSLLNMKEKIKVYVSFAPRKKYNFFTGSGTDFFPSPPEMKKKIIEGFQQKHKKKPIANL